LSQILKKYHPSGNLKFNNLGIQSLELRILMEKILSNSLKLSLIPNTIGCFGLGWLGSKRIRKKAVVNG